MMDIIMIESLDQKMNLWIKDLGGVPKMSVITLHFRSLSLKW